jgi:transposase
LAAKLVLAHPGKMRVIAESVNKTDKVDARTLAEFLALDMIPPAYRPTAREREHRRLVRHRVRVQQRRSSVRCRLRYLLGDYNADRSDLFTAGGRDYLLAVEVSAVDRVVRQQMLAEYDLLSDQISDLDQQLREFAKGATGKEKLAREIWQTIPGIGRIITEVACAELGNIERFSSLKKACAYAGLAPGRRESDGKCKDMPITKRGSRILRWALVEGAWQLVRYSVRWRNIFENLARRRGRKRAIIAVARRLLGMMISMLKSGRAYDEDCIGEPTPSVHRPGRRPTSAEKAGKARARRRGRTKDKESESKMRPFPAEASNNDP